MRLPRCVALAALLAACSAPGPALDVVEQSVDHVSYRGPAEDESEMEAAARRHCAQSSRQPALRFFNREGVRGERLYTLYQCL